jgi:hypothetical protein
LKYLREQTIAKENEQRNGTDKDFNEESVSDNKLTPVSKMGLGEGVDK